MKITIEKTANGWLFDVLDFSGYRFLALDPRDGLARVLDAYEKPHAIDLVIEYPKLRSE